MAKTGVKLTKKKPKRSAAKTIKINCTGSGVCELKKLRVIQGELKTLSPENEAKLRKRIEKYGFDAPFFVWKNKILDGTQRKIVLDKMIEDGWKLPAGKVPVCQIKAKNLNDAKQRLLGYVSQYGKIDASGLDVFLKGIEVPDLATIDLPDFTLSTDDGGQGDIRVPDELEQYLSFVVTKEEKCEIEGCLDEQEGNNRTEQLLCLARTT